MQTVFCISLFSILISCERESNDPNDLQDDERIVHVPSTFLTIQAGIDAANNGDTVLVEPGIYKENIDFQGKNIVVGSLFLTTGDTSTIRQTIINGNQSGSVVSFKSGENSKSVLIGFLIRNGNGTYKSDPIGLDMYGYYGGGIYCENSNPTLSFLIITNNTTVFESGFYIDFGGGIFCDNSSPIISSMRIYNNTSSVGGGIYCINGSSPKIGNVLIYENRSREAGGGVACGYFSNPYIINSTIVGNYSGLITGGLYCDRNSNPIVMNSILWNNIPSEIDEYTMGIVSVTYSNIYGGREGEGNINENPIFVNAQSDNFHFQFGSPCIDAGNPLSEFTDWDGSRNDMGAYGGPEGDW